MLGAQQLNSTTVLTDNKKYHTATTIPIESKHSNKRVTCNTASMNLICKQAFSR